MNTVKETDSDVVYTTKYGQSIHIDPDCKSLVRSDDVNEVSAERFPHRIVCQNCDPDFDIDTSPHSGFSGCNTCGGEVTNGKCEYCETFDEIMSEKPEAGDITEFYEGMVKIDGG